MKRHGSDKVILAGDIGGTKTLLALFSPDQGINRPLKEERFINREFKDFEAILHRFLDPVPHQPITACLGVAGRIDGCQCRITNLPWLIDADKVSAQFKIPRVDLLNDLQAVAKAVPHLDAAQVVTLNRGRCNPAGVVGVIAPGTGLGESFLTPTADGYTVWPTEGGHASFAPVTLEQFELLKFLKGQLGHVSFERVCSGSGFPNIYAFLLATGRYEEPHWLAEQLARAEDATSILIEAGYQRKTLICIAALDLFVRILGGVVGNMALKIMATGGIYIGGGIFRRIPDRLQQQDFQDAICDKGRFREWLSQIPVHVILESKAALHGAAWHAAEMIGGYHR